MQHLAAERVMLNIANERQALAVPFVNRKINQQNFRMRGMDHVFEILRRDFEVLRLIMAAVNHGRNAAIRTHFLHPGAFLQFAWERAQ